MASAAVIGLGRVGSALAFSFLFHRDVEAVFVTETEESRLEGELADLAAASCIIRKRNVFSIFNRQHADYYFICAGSPRKDPAENDAALLKRNLPIVADVTKGLPKERCYIITNPSNALASALGARALGDGLDKAREEFGLPGGLEVLALKGYTNWGIVAEAWKVISNKKK